MCRMSAFVHPASNDLGPLRACKRSRPPGSERYERLRRTETSGLEDVSVGSFAVRHFREGLIGFWLYELKRRKATLAQLQAAMDFLKAEIANKRKALDRPSTSTGNGSVSDGPPAKKYLSKGELERMRKEDEAKAAADAKRAKAEQRDRKLLEGAKRVRLHACR